MFLRIRLVDADGVDPKCPGPVRQPNPAQSITQVGRDVSDVAIAIDAMFSDWHAPDIRDGLEGRNLIEMGSADGAGEGIGGSTGRMKNQVSKKGPTR